MSRKRIVSILLASILCVGSIIQPVQAKTISSTKKEAQRLEKQKKAAEREQASLESQLNKIIKDMQKAQKDVEVKETEISKAEDQLVEAEIKANDQYESMKIRIKFMYENGQTDMLEVLLTADSMGDFLNKAEYVRQVSDYDRKMLQEFKNVVKDVQGKRDSLKAEKEKLVSLQETLSGKKKEVNSLLVSKNAEISNLEDKIGENAKLLAKLIADAEAAEQRRKEQEAANSKPKPPVNNGGGSNNGGSNGGGSNNGGNVKPPSITGNGTLTSPCPGGRVSSEYGPRKAPVAGASTFHRGRDYAASTGTPVYAGTSGTVVTVSYSSARGNYIVINHGNGLQTWYQHLSATYVSQGQKVGRGQNIGAVGHTGISSGPHLHFEVHANGAAVDPRKYL